MLLNPLRYMAVMMTLGFAIYVFGIEFTKDASNDMHAFNEYAKRERSQKRQRQEQQQLLLSELFSKCIGSHMDAKEFSKICA